MECALLYYRVCVSVFAAYVCVCVCCLCVCLMPVCVCVWCVSCVRARVCVLCEYLYIARDVCVNFNA